MHGTENRAGKENFRTFFPTVRYGMSGKGQEIDLRPPPPIFCGAWPQCTVLFFFLSVLLCGITSMEYPLYSRYDPENATKWNQLPQKNFWKERTGNILIFR